MECRKTFREMIYRNEWTIAVEDLYEDKLVKFMERHGIRFKKKDSLRLPMIGWFSTYEIWSAGDIEPSRYAIESQLKALREEGTERKNSKVED